MDNSRRDWQQEIKLTSSTSCNYMLVGDEVGMWGVLMPTNASSLYLLSLSLPGLLHTEHKHLSFGILSSKGMRCRGQDALLRAPQLLAGWHPPASTGLYHHIMGAAGMGRDRLPLLASVLSRPPSGAEAAAEEAARGQKDSTPGRETGTTDENHAP